MRQHSGISSKIWNGSGRVIYKRPSGSSRVSDNSIMKIGKSFCGEKLYKLYV